MTLIITCNIIIFSIICNHDYLDTNNIINLRIKSIYEICSLFRTTLVVTGIGMRIVTWSMTLRHLELRIENLNIIPSLTAATPVTQNANHFVLNMRHFLKIPDAKGDKEVVDNLGPDLLGHVVSELSNGPLDFVLQRHFLQFVPARLQAFVSCTVLLVVGRMLLFFALEDNSRLTDKNSKKLTLIFSSCSFILMYSLLISQYSLIFFFSS